MRAPELARRGFVALVVIGALGGAAAAQMSRAAGAREGDPRLAEARRLIAADDLSAARAQIQDVLRQAPTSPDAHYLLGMIAERRNQLDEAAAAYRAALKGNPGMANARDR